METLLTKTKILLKSEYVIKIEKGTIIELINNKIVKTYKKGNYIFYNNIYTYITQELTIISYLSLNQIWNNLYYNKILNEILKQKLQIDILKKQDSLTKITTYLYLKYLEKNIPTFYIDKIETLSSELNIKKREISNNFSFLIKTNIITKQNKLIIINNLEKLKSLT